MEIVAVVIADFQAETDEEISLIAGSEVIVKIQDEDGWWTIITAEGREGIFPGSYLRILEAAEPEEEEEQPAEEIAPAKSQAQPQVQRALPKPQDSSPVPVPRGGAPRGGGGPARGGPPRGRGSPAGSPGAAGPARGGPAGAPQVRGRGGVAGSPSASPQRGRPLPSAGAPRGQPGAGPGGAGPGGAGRGSPVARGQPGVPRGGGGGAAGAGGAAGGSPGSRALPTPVVETPASNPPTPIPKSSDEVVALEESTDSEDVTETGSDSEKNETEEKEEAPEESSGRSEKDEKREQHRAKVIQEIIDTERDYVRDLDTVVTVFLNPLREKKIIPESDIVALFSNIELLVQVNREVSKEFEKAGETKDGPVLLGPIFIQMAHYFKMYTTYCSNQPVALATLDKCGKVPAFDAFLKECMELEHCRGLTLFSFLIKPIQRICKYPLLLRDLIKDTPDDHPDYQTLQSAFSQIEEVVEYVNERKRLAENLQKILAIQELIEGGENLGLVEPSRRYVKEGTFVVIEKGNKRERRIYLFNDLVVITKPKKSLMGNAKDHLKAKFSLGEIRIVDVADTEGVKDAVEICSKSGTNPVSLKFVFPSIDDKRTWLKDLRTLVKKFQQKEAQEKKAAMEKKAEEDRLRAAGLLPTEETEVPSIETSIDLKGSSGGLGRSSSPSIKIRPASSRDGEAASASPSSLSVSAGSSSPTNRKSLSILGRPAPPAGYSSPSRPVAKSPGAPPPMPPKPAKATSSPLFGKKKDKEEKKDKDKDKDKKQGKKMDRTLMVRSDSMPNIAGSKPPPKGFSRELAKTLAKNGMAET